MTVRGPAAKRWPWVLGSMEAAQAEMERPDVPPRSGAGGAGMLQARRVGAMRGGDTPFMSMG